MPRRCASRASSPSACATSCWRRTSPPRALNGAELFGLLWRRANPELADRGQRPSVPGLSALDAAGTAEQASERARALGDALALTAIDASDHRHLRVGGDLEQVIYASGLPDATWLGWLLEAMEVPRPFTLTVHVRALDRVSERRRLRRKHLRVHGINLGRAEAQRPVDPDSRRQEHELDAAIAELRGGQGARPFEVSIYQSVRQRGPDPSVAGLGEAVETAARALAHATDVPVHAGLLRQLELWRSTLPLGVDHARRSQLYFTRHVADTLPLVGTSVRVTRGRAAGVRCPGGHGAVPGLLGPRARQQRAGGAGQERRRQDAVHRRAWSPNCWRRGRRAWSSIAPTTTSSCVS